MKHLIRIIGIVISCTPLWSLWSFDYSALKQKALSMPTVKDFVDGEKKTTPSHKSRLVRLSEEIESGTKRELIDDLHDEGCLLDLYAELTSKSAWVEKTGRSITFKTVFALLDSFLECRSKARAVYVDNAQRMDMISAEILRLSEEISDLEQDEKLVAMLTEDQKTKDTLRDIALTKSVQKNATFEKQPVRQYLMESNIQRSALYVELTQATKEVIKTLEKQLSLIKAQLALKKETFTKLSDAREICQMESNEKMAKLALWDEQIMRIGLIFKGTLSPALMTELLEEYLIMKKLYAVTISDDEINQKDDFEKINAILMGITQESSSS